MKGTGTASGEQTTQGLNTVIFKTWSCICLENVSCIGNNLALSKVFWSRKGWLKQHSPWEWNLSFSDTLIVCWKSGNHQWHCQGIKKKLNSGENIYLIAHIPENLTMMSLYVKSWDSFTYLLPPSASYIIFPIASNNNVKLQRVLLLLTLLFPFNLCEWVSQTKRTGFSHRCKHLCVFFHFSFNPPPAPQEQLFVPHIS